MGSKTKKSYAFGKFGAGFGTRVKSRFNSVETEQRKKQNDHLCQPETMTGNRQQPGNRFVPASDLPP